jgi:hypothetical protein
VRIAAAWNETLFPEEDRGQQIIGADREGAGNAR